MSGNPSPSSASHASTTAGSAWRDASTTSAGVGGVAAIPRAMLISAPREASADAISGTAGTMAFWYRSVRTPMLPRADSPCTSSHSHSGVIARTSLASRLTSPGQVYSDRRYSRSPWLDQAAVSQPVQPDRDTGCRSGLASM